MCTDFAHQLRYWNTSSAEPGRGFAYWVRTLCDELVELQIKSHQEERFEASMLQKELGLVSLNFIFTSEVQKAWRTSEAICRSRDSRFDLLYVRNGTFAFEHYGQNFTVRPNECVLIDSTSPYSFECSARAESTSLQIPQKWLRSFLAVPEDGVAKVITEHTPWGKALNSTLSALTPESLAELTLPGQMISEQIATLLTLAIGPTRVPVTSRQRKLLPQVRQVLRDHAYNELLTPAKAAKACAISKRHLHALFAAAGSTFSKELMTIRLDRGLRMLADPSFANTSVAEIAQRCGFSDSSHFARRFHQKYGVAPRAYRQSLPTVATPKSNDIRMAAISSD